MAAPITANRAELIAIADAVAREKSIDRLIVIEAMEDAIQRAARARYGAENDIRALGERVEHIFAQLRASHHRIFRDADIPAKRESIRQKIDARQRSREGKRDAVDGVRVHNRAKIRPCAVSCPVEKDFAGRLVPAAECAVLVDADDVLRSQAAFVVAFWRDPDIAVFIHDGDIAAGCGRQPAIINTAHDKCDLLRGGLVKKLHKL